MLRPFQIHEPDTIPSAVRLLERYGGDAALYAGGTELIAVMKEGLAHYDHLINLKTIPGLDAIDDRDSMLRIGALATHRQIERSPVVAATAPVLAQIAGQIANLRVRNAGTIGGNLCFAEPHSDPAPALIALDATLLLVGAGGERHLRIEDFFVGILQTARVQAEILVRLQIPAAPLGSAVSYQRFVLHERPTAGVAAQLMVRDGGITVARVAIASVGPTPARVPEAEDQLVGRPPEGAVLREAATAAARAVEVLDDLYGAVDYKRHIVRILAETALTEAAARAGRTH